MLTNARFPFATSRLLHELSRQETPFVPAVDIVEEKEAFVVHAELPGVSIDDIHIEVEQNVLTLRGEKKGELERGAEGVHRVERWSGAFTRQFALPRRIDAEGIEASLKQGILTLRLPKRSEAKAQKITVKAA